MWHELRQICTYIGTNTWALVGLSQIWGEFGHGTQCTFDSIPPESASFRMSASVYSKITSIIRDSHPAESLPQTLTA